MYTVSMKSKDCATNPLKWLINLKIQVHAGKIVKYFILCCRILLF